MSMYIFFFLPKGNVYIKYGPNLIYSLDKDFTHRSAIALIFDLGQNHIILKKYFVSKVCADWEKIMFWISDADGQLDEEIDHFKAPKKELNKIGIK